MVVEKFSVEEYILYFLLVVIFIEKLMVDFLSCDCDVINLYYRLIFYYISLFV